MDLTRREAVVGLVGCSLGVEFVGFTTDGEPDSLISTLRAAAEVVAPQTVEVDDVFVSQYVLERARVDPDYRRHISEAVSQLDTQARRKYQRRFAALDPPKRRRVFRSLGVHVSNPHPDGMLSQRIRYYIVNDLQYALYTHTLGGKAVGVENPPGYPGGTEAYRRGPGE